jgi:dTDP-L-rhamnose 4-epimerase
VCHQAAVVGAGVDALDAPAFASHNDLGTAVLLAAMARAGCARLVLASSMVVYGEGRYRGADDATRSITDLRAGRFDPVDADGRPLTWELVPEDAPLRPRSFYAASKLAQEHFALAWTRTTGGSVVALRYHNVYGPGMPRDTPYSGVAAMFRSSLERGEPPRVFEDGRQMRDFVEVSDVARANRLAVESAVAGFEAVNVCSGRPISILEVASALSDAVRGPAPVVTGEFRPGDVRHIVASPAKARDVLGFEAAVAPKAGLATFATAPLRESTPARRPSV